VLPDFSGSRESSVSAPGYFQVHTEYTLLEIPDRREKVKIKLLQKEYIFSFF